MSLAQPNLKVWSDLVYDNAIGKTKGTPDPVNTNQAGVTIAKKDAMTVIGFLVNYVLSIVTDAEVMPNLILEVTNKALGITQEEIVIPSGTNDGDANVGYSPVITKFVPFEMPDGKVDKLFNSEFTFKAGPSSTNTAGLSPFIAVLYANQEPDPSFILELMTQMHKRIAGGKAAADAAKAHATADSEVALTSLEIEAGATQLLALLSSMQPNGITASDPIAGYMEFHGKGIPDFSPQLWPFHTFWNPALGTVTRQIPLSGQGRYYPTRFPMTGAKVTIQVKSLISVLAGAAPDTTQAVYYSRS